mgnify:CR=1 FL=1
MSENTPSTAGMDPALDPPAVVTVGTERELLQAWLDYHRQTLRWKCSGLTPEQLCQASAGPSRMSLAGLMRHMTDVEVWWFGRVALGDEAAVDRYPGEDEDLCQATPETVSADRDAFEAAVRRSDEVFAGLDLDGVAAWQPRRTPISNRWILIHMVEEWARHNGHADLIRERLDGAAGS